MRTMCFLLPIGSLDVDVNRWLGACTGELRAGDMMRSVKKLKTCEIRRGTAWMMVIFCIPDIHYTLVGIDLNLSGL